MRTTGEAVAVRGVVIDAVRSAGCGAARETACDAACGVPFGAACPGSGRPARRTPGLAGRLAAFATVALVAGGALAQDWPNRAVRVVVPFGPGSGTDVATRVLGEHLGAALGQSIVVENRAGANGSIAATAVARAKPDGYTFLMGTNSTHGANPGLQKNLPYDPLKDFVPVRLVGTFSSYLVVHPAVPARSVAELVAHLKANPGRLNIAAGNTSSLIMGEMFKRAAGVDAVVVRYPSNPPGMTDVVAGRVSMMFPDISSSNAQVKAGALRALAVVSMGERHRLAPELPTMTEAGFAGFNFVGWIGLFAPAGTPDAVIDRMSRDLGTALERPEVKQRLEQLGADVRQMGPEPFRELVRSEVVRLPKILAEIGVQPE